MLCTLCVNRDSVKKIGGVSGRRSEVQTLKRWYHQWFWLGLFAIIGLVVCFGEACFAATRAEKQKIEKLSNEIEELRDTLSVLQKKLDGLNQNVGQMVDVVLDKKEEGERQIENTSLWTLQRLEQLNQYVQGRLVEFVKGIISLRELPPLIQAHKKELRVQLFYFFINLIFGIISAWWGISWLRPYLRQLMNSGKSRKSGLLAQLSVLSSSLLFPFIGSLILALSLNLILETVTFTWARSYLFDCDHASGCPQNAFLFLSSYVYMLFAVFLWTRIVFIPSKRRAALVHMPKSSSFGITLFIRLAAIAFFCGNLWGSLAFVFHMDVVSSRAFSDLMILLASAFFIQSLTWFQNELKKEPSDQAILATRRWLSFIKWAVFILCSLWLLARQWLDQFLLPGLLVGTVFLITEPLQQILRRWRLQKLWKYRHHKFFLKSWLMSHRFMERVTRWCIYGIFFIALWVYLENFGGEKAFIPLWRWFSGSLSSPLFGRLTYSVLMMSIAYVLVKVGDRILQYYVEEKYSGSHENKLIASRLKTLMAMLRTLLRIVVWVPAFIMIATQFVGAANLMTLGASLGGASFGLTFGFQSIVRDFVTGFFLIIENNLMVGDEIVVDSHDGVVEEISLRTLKIRGDNGALLTIPFGAISIISNMSRRFCAIVMNISASYKESPEKIQECAEKAFQLLKKTPGVGRHTFSPLEVRGLQEVTSYSIVFQVRIRTAPGYQHMVRRTYNKLLKKIFDEEGISVPNTPCSVALSQPSLTNTLTYR